MTTTTTPRLELKQIVKQFPGCLANDHVDLTVQPGEIHALLGENGAGKSTRVKIIYGVLKPDDGTISIEGKTLPIASPAHARSLGIGMVFQHFSLFEALTVKDNIALGMSRPPPMKALQQQIVDVAGRYGLAIDPNRPVHRLSVGEKQRIEIVRCLLQNPRILIMDEPTSVLTPQEAEKLFTTLRQLAQEGCSILYISHKLEEVQVLCQNATILRQGRNVAVCDPRRETARSMAQLMVGAELHDPDRLPLRESADIILQVDHLTLSSDDPFGVDLQDITLELRAGEILGIAGVAGNGQVELLAALSGEKPGANETIRLRNRPIGRLGPRARRAAGLGVIPENRLGHAAVPGLSLTDNAFLTGYISQPFTRQGFVRNGKIREFATRVVQRFDVRTSSIDTAAASLSGGNLQKFIVGREVMQQPQVLIVAQPTWGVDAGAEIAIHQALHDLAANGTAVLVISQDLDELFALSHRITAICGGRLGGPALPVEQVTREAIGLQMTGSRSAEAA
jgi:simple sugar transport system ATP-binding protein